MEFAKEYCIDLLRYIAGLPNLDNGFNKNHIKFLANASHILMDIEKDCIKLGEDYAHLWWSTENETYIMDWIYNEIMSCYGPAYVEDEPDYFIAHVGVCLRVARRGEGLDNDAIMQIIQKILDVPNMIAYIFNYYYFRMPCRDC
jgi:hypothetical protein